MGTPQAKVLAIALREIRTLLAGQLGSTADAPLEIRIAAHIAYALHNEVQATIDDAGFNVDQAIKKIEAIDQILSVTDGKALAEIMKGNA